MKNMCFQFYFVKSQGFNKNKGAEMTEEYKNEKACQNYPLPEIMDQAIR